MMTVSNSHVEEMLKTSGKSGIIVDLTSRESDEAYNFARIRMPSDLKMPDVIKKIEALPQNLRKETRGIIPSYWGYSVRVTRQAESEVTRILNPQEAEDLGPALGMTASSEWVVKGIPSYATKPQIIKTLAQAGNGWPGWTVRPRKTLSKQRGGSGKSTWLLEAANDPPLRAITLNNAVISIEMYIERPNPALKKILAPTRSLQREAKDPENAHQKSFFEDDISDEEDEGQEENKMEVDNPRGPNPEQAGNQQMETSRSYAEAVSRNSQQGGETANQDQQLQETQCPAKRKCQENDSEQTPAATSTMDSMFQHMKAEAERAAAESAKKDALIMGLQQTIAGLQEEIKALRQSVSVLTSATAQNK